MKLFSADFLAEVRSTVGTGGYYPEDFGFEEANDADFKMFTIQYLAHPNFYFKIKIRIHDKTATDTFRMFRQTVEEVGDMHVYVCPGEILNVDHLKPESKESVLGAIRQWVNRMDNELTALPLRRKLEEQRQQLEALAEEVGKITEGYFSLDEAEELKGRLEAFEARFAEHITHTTEDSKEAARKIAVLHDEIELLKRQIVQLSKQGWAKSMLVRVSNWMRDPTNRQLLQSGSDLAKSILLPPGSSGGKGDA